MSSKSRTDKEKKRSDTKPEKTKSPASNQEKKDPKNADLTKKIKNLEDDNKRLCTENIMLKNNFNLKEILKALSVQGITEMDAIELSNVAVKTALKEADEKYSVETAEMERKHKKEIEQLKQNTQEEDQLPTTSSSQEPNNGKTDIYVKSLEGEKQQLAKALHDEKTNHAKRISDLESKHKEEIDQLKRNLNGRDQLPTVSSGNSKHSQDADKEIAKYEAQNKDLERQIKTLKAEKDALNNNIKELETDKDILKKKLDKTEGMLSEKENEIKRLKEEIANIQARNQDAASKPVSTDDIHTRLKTTKEKDSSKRENADLLAEKHTRDAEIKKLQDEIKQLEEMNKDLKKEKDVVLAEKQKQDAAIKRLQDQNQALKEIEEKNKNLNENLKQLKEENDDLKKQLTKLKKEYDEVNNRLKERQSPPLSNIISANDNKAVKQLKEENERLRTRLSEMAGAQMTHNNPNIADLSDAFRPTKLSEEYNQLYDNLWTDAFEEHGGKKEEDVIEILRKTLLGCYTFCENVSREFTDQLAHSSLALPNSQPKNEDIPIVYKKQLQDMKKSFGVLLRNDVKESYRKQNKTEGGPKTKSYIDACVELCWLMVIQEPPVVIETPAFKDSAFDSDTYKTYTKTGKKVEFVVWPALRLHERGPLLAKGVAQGKN